MTAPAPVASAPASVLRRGTRLLWQSVRTHPGPFALSVAGATVFALMAVGGTIVLGRVTDSVIVPAFGEGVSHRAVATGALAVLAVAAARSGGVVLRRYFGNMTSRRMQRTWFVRIADRYVDVPLSWIGGRSTGELLAHVDADTERAITSLQPLPMSLSIVVIVGFSTVSLALVDPIICAIALCLFPALALLNQAYSRRVEAPAARAQAAVGRVAAVAHESFDGALLVKTLGREDAERDRLADAASILRRERLDVGRLRAGFEPALDALPNLGTIALLALGASRVSSGALTTGELVQAMALFGILAFPMRVLGFLFEELPRAVVAHDRIERVLADAAEALPSHGTLALPEGPLAVEVRDVVQGYGGDRVLDEMTFTLRPGEVVALVGPTGAGKTSLCELLAGLVSPESGGITLSGVALDDIAPDELHRAVALVFQEAFLFAASVRENLVLDAAYDDDDIAWALEIARADRFVTRLPHRLEQRIGERGVTLSGGQRQRLALARALLRRPQLLLLDDATSAVDATVEQQILSGLRASLASTTLIVAHRVSTIALADRVLMLEGGRIAASGSHAELLASVPAYDALVRAYEIEGAA
jgi:ABC-type multidrug transport system fused ATPase/permease subunit